MGRREKERVRPSKKPRIVRLVPDFFQEYTNVAPSCDEGHEKTVAQLVTTA